MATPNHKRFTNTGRNEPDIPNKRYQLTKSNPWSTIGTGKNISGTYKPIYQRIPNYQQFRNNLKRKSRTMVSSKKADIQPRKPMDIDQITISNGEPNDEQTIATNLQNSRTEQTLSSSNPGGTDLPRCRICNGKKGVHDYKECPDIICGKCRGPHNRSKCDQFICELCGQQGHHQLNCHLTQCTYCYEYKHIEEYCPKRILWDTNRNQT
ncbi:13169_t:CDS:1, partial [Ambispora leptoticha]